MHGSSATRPRLETVVVTSRAARASAMASAASFTMRGAARRSGFFSSLIMDIMRRFREAARIRGQLALHLGGHIG